MKTFLWVVEWKHGKVWKPTNVAMAVREDARKHVRWKRRISALTEFRVTKYVPEKRKK